MERDTTPKTEPLNSLTAELSLEADTTRAAAQQAYLKSPLEHLGVGVPETRKILRRWIRAQGELNHGSLWAYAGQMWKSPIYELRLCAVEALMYRTESLDAADLPRLRTMIASTFTWALVDPLSVWVVGDITATMASNDVDSVLDWWATDDSYWVRRASMLSQLRYLRRPTADPSRFFRYADAMLDEREFFICKAIGWVLRDMSRVRADIVYDWLLPRASRASGVTMREAVKYLSPNQACALREARNASP